jgi:hypothetical protein
MKRIITIFAAILMTACVFAQSPNKMSYQAVIRNTSNALVTNSAVGMRISILQTTPSGTAVYVETQTPTTNANGLASIEIGGGTVVSGNFSTIDWASGPYFVKTETDPAGGTSYTITGTSQLLSVPYALHAKSTDSWIVNGDTTYTLKKVVIGTNSSTSFGGDQFPVQIIGGDATNASSKSRMSIYRVDPSQGGSAIHLRKAAGTALNNPLATPSGNTLGEIIFGGHDGTAFSPGGGSLIRSLSTENYTPTAMGGKLQFQTTPNGQTARVTRFTITESGSVIYHPLSTAPTSPVKGETYFDNNSNKLRVWDGTTWQNCW